MNKYLSDCGNCKGTGKTSGRLCRECMGIGTKPTEEGQEILELIETHLRLFTPCLECDGVGHHQDSNHPCMFCAESGGTASPFGKRLAEFWTNFCNAWNTAQKHLFMTCPSCDGREVHDGRECHCQNGRVPTNYARGLIILLREYVRDHVNAPEEH